MRKFLRFIGFVSLLIIGGIGVIAYLNWPTVKQVAKFSPIILPPFYGTPENEVEARDQDTRYLRKLVKLDRSFSTEARRSFAVLLDELENGSRPSSQAELYMAAAQAAAFADNGHTSISARPLYREFNRIDVKLFWFSDGLYIVRAKGEYADLIGARVVAIDDRAIEDIATTLRRYSGGADQWRRLYSVLMIESPQIMHATGLARSPDEMTISVVNSDDLERDVTLKGSKIDGQGALPTRRPWMTLKPVALRDEGEDWRRTLGASEKELPLYLRDSNNRLFAAKLDGGAYIRTQITLDTPTKAFEPFLEDAVNQYRGGELDFMIVDLRWNPGGDYTKAINFAKTAPGKIKPGGRLYIVVGPQTFSAALVTAALLKYYGGEKSVIVGAPMGDREQFWAESGMAFRLPNSGYRINYATGYHDWAAGCEGHPYCFAQNLIHGVPAGSLAPAVVIEPTYADYASGHDIVMDWILSQHTSSPKS